MPRAAPTACAYPGCAALVPGSSYCEEHTTERKRAYRGAAERKQLEAFYNSRAWRATSIAYRKRPPVCVQCCERGVVRPCDVVDHIVEIRDAPALRFVQSNLQALCHACHNNKTAAVRASRKQ